jgi:hypothetical protein
MERNGNEMKVVESLWNGMEWKWNSNFQDFGPLIESITFH